MVTPNTFIGQHFLKDEGVLQQTRELIPPGMRCVEIGAGPGILTEGLLSDGHAVTAYEVDDRFKPVLDQLASAAPLEVKWESFLDAPDDELNADTPYCIVGNIPFHISEPLMFRLKDLRFDTAVLLTGERLSRALTTTNPDQNTWGRMSLLANAYFNVEKVRDVPRASFDPPPRVNSALIRLTRKDADDGWRSDAFTRACRSLVEANATNSTIGKALKSVIIASNGEAVTGSSSRRTEQMSVIRTILSVVSPQVDERILSKPLSGVSNQDLCKVCSVVSSEVNHLQKRQAAVAQSVPVE